jgi:hypothetical protein
MGDLVEVRAASLCEQQLAVHHSSYDAPTSDPASKRTDRTAHRCMHGHLLSLTHSPLCKDGVVARDSTTVSEVISIVPRKR